MHRRTLLAADEWVRKRTHSRQKLPIGWRLRDDFEQLLDAWETAHPDSAMA